MTTYAVFDRNANAAPAAVADRFTGFAAIMPPSYFVAQGRVLALVGYIVAPAGGIAASNWIGDDVAFWLYVLLSIWIGFEASGFRRAALARSGWHYRADVIAAAADLAQVEWLKRISPDA